MYLAIGTDVKSDMEAIKEVTDQVKNADPGKVKAYFEGLLPGVVDFGLKVLLAFVIYFVGVKIIKQLRKLLRRFLDRSHVDEGVKQFLDSLAKAVLYFCLVIIICSWLGIPTTSVAALLGSIGLAIGLALQGSLSNFAGGVLILLIKPFKVGDYIIEDNHKNEGTVAEIELFYTRLLTPDNRMVVIPNGTLSNSSLTNVTRQEKRRVDIAVGVSYDADIRKVKEILTELLLDEPKRLAEEEILVFVSELADSCVQMGCRLWVKTEDYWPVKWRLTEEIKLKLDENGIEIPYNQLEVTVKHTS